jgi:hypothetical protein
MRGALNSFLGMMHAQRTPGETDQAGVGVRIAVYPRSGTPEITEVSASDPGSATRKFTKIVSEKVREAGGRVPEESIREVVENLIHAGYQGVVISVLEDGNVVRVSDKGPGVENKSRAMEIGFSGAAPGALGEIRGIGAGLGIARAAAEKVGHHRGQYRWRHSGHRLCGGHRDCHRGRRGGISATPAEAVPRRSTADEHLREAAEGTYHGTRVWRGRSFDRG